MELIKTVSSSRSYFSQRIENVVTDMEQCFSMVETAAAERDGMNKEEAA